jgi:hypothetical protein
MPTTTRKAVQVLDLMLDFLADDDHWTRGSYDDRNGRRCLVGAFLHFSANDSLARAQVMSLLQAALPRRQRGLITFNDRFCRGAADIRSVILKARAIAIEDVQHSRAAEAFSRRLTGEPDRDRAISRTPGEPAPEEMPSTRRRAA